MGIYVVPAIGVATAQEDPLLAGGGIQLSFWFGG